MDVLLGEQEVEASMMVCHLPFTPFSFLRVRERERERMGEGERRRG